MWFPASDWGRHVEGAPCFYRVNPCISLETKQKRVNAFTALRSKGHARNEVKTGIYKFLCLGKVDSSEVRLTKNILQNPKCQSTSLYSL